MPVREALQRLARIGLVEMSASRYTRVTTPTPELAQQTLEYTGYQAGLAMRMAIPRMTDDDLAQTVALIDAKITASDADDIPTLYAAARSLYAFVSARTGNTVFAVMMREAGLAMERNLRGLRPVLGDVAERGALYRELRAAVVARDRDGAERAVREQHGLGSRNLRVIGLDDLSPQP
ncbi:MAG: FCD domain-containing protein [Candidatus Microbacterium phytovorans]|uniref:FCD domain-containing protein n=1 Tax=Candidatus Microbacterium phytovorans TaxID=3121374 RepID=A0AAJ5VZ68_9MICO|nr:FCD domain-containing protein [Microbacterium sp.]WEK12969.1 MAG: FCD domain-containing protein [Microbacterium sp.]